MIPQMHVVKVYYVHVDSFCFNVPSEQKTILPVDIRKKVIYGSKLNGKTALETADKDVAMKFYEEQKKSCGTYKQTGLLTAEVSGTCCYIEAKTQNHRGEHISNLGVIDFYAQPYIEEEDEDDVEALF